MNTDDISDGFHTFGELYAHRTALFAALCASNPEISWRSKLHHEDCGDMPDGFFLAGMDLPTGPICYHQRLEYWDVFKACTTVERAPKWISAGKDIAVLRLAEWAKMA
jgi:hypothetical protein